MKVVWIINDYYKVIIRQEGVYDYECEALYKGSLSDCEAFIRLTEGGYL